MAETKIIPSPASEREVGLRDETGADIGVVVKVGPPEPGADDGIGALADRITGWSKLVVDGRPYTFSKGRALALLNRFPHYAEQIRAAESTRT